MLSHKLQNTNYYYLVMKEHYSLQIMLIVQETTNCQSPNRVITDENILHKIYLKLYKPWPEAVSKIKLQMLLTAFADKHNSTLCSCLNMARLSDTVNPYQALSPAYFWTWSILRGPLGQGEIRNQAKRSWVMRELTRASHKHFGTKQSLSWAIEICFCSPASICF